MASSLQPLSDLPGPDLPGYSPRGPWRGRALAGAAVIALLAGVWWAAHQQSTVIRKAAEDSVLIPVVPPPPPPPPPEQPKPVEKPEEVPPQPTPQQPQPTTQPPSPQPAAPSQGQAVSIDGPPQAGGDGFNIGLGPGGGMRGGGAIGNALGGFNRAAYGAYLEGELRHALEASKDLRTAALKVRARMWIDETGRITRVEVGGTDKAEAIRLALIGHKVRPPDPSLAMPVAIGLDLRRPG